MERVAAEQEQGQGPQGQGSTIKVAPAERESQRQESRPTNPAPTGEPMNLGKAIRMLSEIISTDEGRNALRAITNPRTLALIEQIDTQLRPPINEQFTDPKKSRFIHSRQIAAHNLHQYFLSAPPTSEVPSARLFNLSSLTSSQKSDGTKVILSKAKDDENNQILRAARYDEYDVLIEAVEALLLPDKGFYALIEDKVGRSNYRVFRGTADQAFMYTFNSILENFKRGKPTVSGTY